MSNICISCKKCVRPCQEGLLCDGCFKWQHRVCDSGVSRQVYQAAVKNGTEIDWKCLNCTQSLPSPPGLPPPTRSLPSPPGLPPPQSLPSPLLSLLLPPAPREQTNITVLSEFDVGSFVVQLANSSLPGDPRGESTRLSIDCASGEVLQYLPEVPSIPTRPNLSSYAIQEESLVDIRPMEISETETLIPEFHIVDEGTERGKSKLIETTGYSYTKKKVNGVRTNWTCSVRGTHNWCKATVNQNGDSFTRGKNNHSHPPAHGLLRHVETNKQIKIIAAKEIFRSAKEIAETVQLEDQEGLGPESCTVDSLARKANRHRQKFQPDDPKDLHFDVDVRYLCSLDKDAKTFYHGSVFINEQRHLIFATPAQLQQLGQAKTWYVDGTFKITSPPFIQLFGVHAFVRSGEAMTQVPLAFILMSRRQTVDYLEVFSALLEKMDLQPQVQRIVSDFEAATWAAIRAILPQVEIKGCLFHWTQAVFKRICQEGLEKSYHEKGSVHKFLKQILCLPYLPAEDIESQFERLTSISNIPPKVLNVIEYVRRTWLRSTVWKVDNWSIFGMPIRTNNNTEGWHRRINARATRDGVQFYLLVPLLLREAKLVNMTMERVSDGRLGRMQCLKHRTRQGEVFAIWRRYTDAEITAKELIRATARLSNH